MLIYFNSIAKSGMLVWAVKNSQPEKNHILSFLLSDKERNESFECSSPLHQRNNAQSLRLFLGRIFPETVLGKFPSLSAASYNSAQKAITVAMQSLPGPGTWNKRPSSCVRLSFFSVDLHRGHVTPRPSVLKRSSVISHRKFWDRHLGTQWH